MAIGAGLLITILVIGNMHEVKEHYITVMNTDYEKNVAENKHMVAEIDALGKQIASHAFIHKKEMADAQAKHDWEIKLHDEAKLKVSREHAQQCRTCDEAKKRVDAMRSKQSDRIKELESRIEVMATMPQTIADICSTAERITINDLAELMSMKRPELVRAIIGMKGIVLDGEFVKTSAIAEMDKQFGKWQDTSGKLDKKL